MLFQAEDMSRVQLEKPSAFKPNTRWNYLRNDEFTFRYLKQFKTHQEYLDFWYTDLIDKIGMNSMVIETDMAGIMWARPTVGLQHEIGLNLLLYLHKRHLERGTNFQ
jgi:hypothetical protein